MTNVRRPIHLQLRPTSVQLGPIPSACASPKAQPMGASADLLPSKILPHLFVGDQAQTNSETLNRLNISYILSLGLLPLVSASNLSPASPPGSPVVETNPNVANITARSAPSARSNHNHLLPSRNSSRDFKIRVKAAPTVASNNSLDAATIKRGLGSPSFLASQQPTSSMDENKGVKAARYIHCKCINIADNSEQGVARFFDEAHQFIEEARRKKCNILVHCLAGVSRSPTFAIAYLMRVNSLSLQDAFNLVKQCRPQIDPNLSFIGQLMVYEKSLDEKQRRRQLHQSKYFKSSNEGRNSPSTGNSIHINTATNENNNKL